MRHRVAAFVVVCMSPLFLACFGSEIDEKTSIQGGDSEFETNTSNGDSDSQGENPFVFPNISQLPFQEETPDPLVLWNGEHVDTAEKWEQERRPEILQLLQHYAYGFTPDSKAQPSVETVVTAEDFLNDSATLHCMILGVGPESDLPVDLLLVTPNDTEEPAPVFLGLNFFGNHTVHADPRIPLTSQWVPSRGEGVVDNHATEASRGTSAGRWPLERIIEHGYALATFYHGALDPDFDDFSNGIHPYFHDASNPQRGTHEWGAVGAWSWGVSRVVDALENIEEIDSSRIVVVGHSRNGKAALWAGAQDTRIALVISNMSGCMGAAMHRRKQGETLFWLNSLYPHWFAPSLQSFNDLEEKLPFDQHFLIALIAPRPVLVASAQDDAWADPEGEFLGAKGATSVYRLLGVDGMEAEEFPPANTLISSRIGYHIRPGGHDVTEDDWRVFIEYATKWLQ